MVISFEELGLVTTKVMFKKAMDKGFAVPAYNFNNMEQLQAIIKGCTESNSPVILQVSSGARKYANPTLLRYMAMGAIQMMKESGANIPIALHLDHGDTFELCKSCVDNGFSSVMIDGSHHPYEENVRLTKQVVDYAHSKGVVVEGELGILAGIEEDVEAEKSTYTRPEEVEDFVSRTGVDSLAISIGTSHGAYKFKLKPGQPLPPLRFDILEEIERRLPGFPIVLHGASSVLQEYVDMINQYGGNLEGAVGVPEEQLRRAAKSAVCKINIDTDGRLVVTAVIRKILAEKPKEFDPRKYLGPARDALSEMIKRKNKEVLGSAGYGKEIMDEIMSSAT
jgi:fructose-bisphosphate aldolase class II